MDNAAPFWDLLGTYWWYFAIPVAFLIVVLYVFRPGAKRRYQKDAEIPLRDETKPGEGQNSSSPH